MGLLRKFFSNTGKPEGVMGRIVVAMMNRGHAGIAAWGFTHLRFRGDEDVLDCGCGGGANLAQLLRLLPKGRVTGLLSHLRGEGTRSQPRGKRHGTLYSSAGQCAGAAV